MYCKNINTRKHNTWCSHTIRLDTYGCGCQHNCSYCYAKSLLSFRKLWDSKNPKPNSILNIKQVLSKLPKYTVVKLGGMTDCFMPLELKKRITFETIKMLNYYKLNYLIVTKSDICVNDEYLSIYDKKLCHLQVSITSTSDEISKKYENATLPFDRIKAIEKLYRNNFDVSIRLSPCIEEFINFDIINSIKCNKILVEFLKVNHFIKKNFDIDYSNYSLNYGGYNHLQLSDKIRIMDKIYNFEQISVGEYVKDHYNYFNEKVNFNKNDCCNLSICSFPKINYTQLSLF